MYIYIHYHGVACATALISAYLKDTIHKYVLYVLVQYITSQKAAPERTFNNVLYILITLTKQDTLTTRVDTIRTTVHSGKLVRPLSDYEVNKYHTPGYIIFSVFIASHQEPTTYLLRYCMY